MANVIVNKQTLTDIADAVRAKTGTHDPIKLSDISAAIDNIPSGGTEAPDNVVFIDYDGTVLHQYSREAFLELNNFPANPNHEEDGLIAQGWNWTIEEAKEYAATGNLLCIGQSYVTASGATEFDIEVLFDNWQIVSFLGINGTVTLDWGDGSPTETMSGASLSEAQMSSPHTYTTQGMYTVKMLVNEGQMTFLPTVPRIAPATGESLNTCNIFQQYDSPYSVAGRNSIIHARLGNNLVLANYTFSNCRNMETITIPKGIGLPQYNAFKHAFSYLYELKGAVLPSDSGITVLPEQLFIATEAANAISIPNAVTDIGNSAFQNCYNLTYSSFTKNLVNIGQYAYSKCSKLKFKEVNFCAGLKAIYRYAFDSCNLMTKVTIPNGFTAFNNGVFKDCVRLKEVTVGEDVSIAAGELFSGCTDLKTVNFTKSVPYILATMFYKTQAVTDLSAFPNITQAIAQQAFAYCNSLTEAIIPNGVTSIGNSAFQNCANLRKVYIPDSVTSIGTSAFASGYALQEIRLSNNLTAIPNQMLQGCNFLPEIEIPASVTSLGSNAFGTCIALGVIRFKSSTPPTAQSNTWSGLMNPNLKIYVPRTSLGAYMTAANYPSKDTYTYIGE